MAARYWVGGSGTWDATSTTNWSTTSGGPNGASVPTISDDVIVDAGSGTNPTITLSSSAGALACASLTANTVASSFVGGADLTVAGNFNFDTAGAAINSLSLTSGALTFTGASLPQVKFPNAGITTTLYDLTINCPGTTLTSFNNVTVSNILTLTAGSWTTDYQIYAKIFSSSNTNTRALTGFGSLNLTGTNTTIYDVTTSTGFSNSTMSVYADNASSSTGTRVFSGPMYRVFVLNGSDSVSFTGPISGTLSFDNIFTGTWLNTALSVGALSISANMTIQAGSNTVTLTASSTLNPNGKTFDFPLTCAAGTTVTLGGALTLGNTRTLTLSGTGFNSGSPGFNTTAANIVWTAGTLNIANVTVTLTGTGTVWNCTSTGALTMTNFARIQMTSTSTLGRTFAGNGKVYTNVIIGGATGVSTTIFTGANTFSLTSTKTVAHTIVFPATLTTTMPVFNVSGTAGNVVTIQSSLVGTAAVWVTTSTQTNINYLSIRDVNGTTATNWYVGANSTNVSGNTNLTFSTVTALYWVGGTGTWSQTGRTNWAISSGGAGNAGVPGPNCDAIFDSNSGASPTITMSAVGTGPAAKSFSIPSTNGTLTFTSTGPLTTSGNFSITGGTVVWNGTGLISFALILPAITTASINVSSSALAAGFACNLGVYSPPLVTTVTLATAILTRAAFTLDSGILDLNNLTLSCLGFFSTGSQYYKSILFGTTGNITMTTGSSSFNMNGLYFTYTGTPTVNLANAGATATTLTTNLNFTEANALNFNFTAGTYTATITANNRVKNLNFTGFNGVVTPNAMTIYGDLTIPASGGTFNTSANTWTLNSTSQTTYTQALNIGRTIAWPITVNTSAFVTTRLNSSLTMLSRVFSLNAGILDLNGFDITGPFFNSFSSSVRQIRFGSNSITVNGTGSVVTFSGSNFSYTGTPTININNNTSTNTIVNFTNFNETNAVNVNVVSGTYALTEAANSFYKNLNYTGFAGTVGNTTKTIYGNLTIPSGVTKTAGTNAWTFGATSGTQTISTGGITIDSPFIFGSGTGTATYAVSGALTLGATNGTITFNNGTLQLPAGLTTTVAGFTTSGTTLKYLTSSSSGTQATLSGASGANTVTFLSIKDSNATGGATWDASAASNVNAGNNTGWFFGGGASNYFLVF